MSIWPVSIITKWVWTKKGQTRNIVDVLSVDCYSVSFDLSCWWRVHVGVEWYLLLNYYTVHMPHSWLHFPSSVPTLYSSHSTISLLFLSSTNKSVDGVSGLNDEIVVNPLMTTIETKPETTENETGVSGNSRRLLCLAFDRHDKWQKQNPINAQILCHFQYSSIDTSPLSVNVMHPFWNYLVQVSWGSRHCTAFVMNINTLINKWWATHSCVSTFVLHCTAFSVSKFTVHTMFIRICFSFLFSFE